MNCKLIQIAIFVSCLGAVSKVSADPALDQARGAARLEKMSTIAEQLSLDKSQEKLFWPIYENYQDELHKLADKRIALIKDLQRMNQTLTDPQATELIRRALELEEQRTALKKRYAGLFLAKLPAKTIARYLQLENKIQAQVDDQIAAQMPLVGN